MKTFRFSQSVEKVALSHFSTLFHINRYLYERVCAMDSESRNLVCLTEHADPAHEAEILSKIPDEDAALDASELFTQLASPIRIRLLCILAIEEMCVCELADMLMMSQPAISHHLRLLRQSGVVKYKKSGKRVIYYITDTPAGVLARFIVKDLMKEESKNEQQDKA